MFYLSIYINVVTFNIFVISNPPYADSILCCKFNDIKLCNGGGSLYVNALLPLFLFFDSGIYLEIVGLIIGFDKASHKGIIPLAPI